MKVLCKYLGGSYSYGLNTPQSDVDERFVFIHTDVSNIFGLKRHDHQSRQNDTEDSFGWELRHFLHLLKNGNTMCLEILYNTTWIEISDEYKYIQSFKNKLIDSKNYTPVLKDILFQKEDWFLEKELDYWEVKEKKHWKNTDIVIKILSNI